MKCQICGCELEKGTAVCPQCGMIINLDSEEQKNDAQTDQVIESVYNVFKSNNTRPDPEPAEETARELQADPTEEKVEFVVSLPEFDLKAPEPIKTSEQEREEALAQNRVEETVVAPAGEDPISAQPENEDIVSPIPDEEPETESPAVSEVVIAEEKSIDTVSPEAEDNAVAEEQVPLEIRVPTANVVYGEHEEYLAEHRSEPKTVTAEEDKSDSLILSAKDKKNKKKKNKKTKREDGAKYKRITNMYELEELGEIEEKTAPETERTSEEVPTEVEADMIPVVSDESNPPKKKGMRIESILGAAIAIILIAGVAAFAVKYFSGNKPTVTLPGVNSSTTDEQTEATTDPFTTENTTEATTEAKTEATTEETSTAETTDATTDKAAESTAANIPAVVTTTEGATKNTTTTKAVTTKPTTTKPVTTTRPTTTKPTTTKPTTTKPTTTKPTTTKPTTTKPTTTKPATTTDPYGINNVAVKKPASYLSKSYTAYVTAEGTNMRSGPAKSYERVVSLSKGADVKVLAKENGFCYVKSNRYGVYGWVSAGLLSESRPQTQATTQASGTVAPDVKYSSPKTMYTTNGLNVRKGPSTNYGKVGLIPIDYPVKVVGYKNGVSGWVYIIDPTYGYMGWVSTAYLK